MYTSLICNPVLHRKWVGKIWLSVGRRRIVLHFGGDETFAKVLLPKIRDVAFEAMNYIGRTIGVTRSAFQASAIHCDVYIIITNR